MASETTLDYGRRAGRSEMGWVLLLAGCVALLAPLMATYVIGANPAAAIEIADRIAPAPSTPAYFLWGVLLLMFVTSAIAACCAVMARRAFRDRAKWPRKMGHFLSTVVVLLGGYQCVLSVSAMAYLWMHH